VFSPAGLFFVIPCTDSYTKVDLRTVSFDVPPQEVSEILILIPYVGQSVIGSNESWVTLA